MSDSTFHTEAAAAIAEKRRAVERLDYERAVADDSPYAAWGTRVGGAIIDGLCAGVAALLLIGAGVSLDAYALSWVLVVLGVAGWLLYEPVFHATWQRTPGKAAVGVFIARERDGGKVGIGRALGREVAKLMLGFIPLVGLLNVVAPLWDGKKRTWHDAVAGTVVVKSESPRGDSAEPDAVV